MGKKSYIIAYGFLVVLGPFGAHHFYLNNYLFGLLYLLTGGFFGIGVVMDIFLLPLYVWVYNRYFVEDWNMIWSKIGRCVSKKLSC